VLSPVVGWKIYVYGSFLSGAAAVVLGAYALSRNGEDTQRKRATFATVAGVVVLLLLYASTRVASRAISRREVVRIDDVSSDVDDPPAFLLLADANHTGGYPRKNVAMMREFHEELLKPKTTSLPIGAAFIRALHIAETLKWRIMTPIAYSTDGYVEPQEWMDKTEVGFEATSTSASPLFRIPDEIVVRVRTHAFDDGYVGAKVVVRSRGHLSDDHGTNAARVKHFLEDDSW